MMTSDCSTPTACASSPPQIEPPAYEIWPFGLLTGNSSRTTTRISEFRRATSIPSGRLFVQILAPVPEGRGVSLAMWRLTAPKCRAMLHCTSHGATSACSGREKQSWRKRSMLLMRNAEILDAQEDRPLPAKGKLGSELLR